jgi:L-alanine-DL-glutamate epimerase-like enolase superfamily enzyme
VDSPFRLNLDGAITVPSGPGVGVIVNEERLTAHTVRFETLG